MGTALFKKKKKKSPWFWPLPVLTYHLVVVCIIVIYLISIVASPALVKTVALCRRLYCKPVWSFVFPPSGFWTQWKCDVYMYSFSEYSLFSQFSCFILTQKSVYIRPDISPPTASSNPPPLRRSECAVSSRVVVVVVLLLLLWWLLKLILNLKNKKGGMGTSPSGPVKRY